MSPFDRRTRQIHPQTKKGRLVGKANQPTDRNDVLCYTESQIAENNQSIREPSPDCAAILLEVRSCTAIVAASIQAEGSAKRWRRWGSRRV